MIKVDYAIGRASETTGLIPIFFGITFLESNELKYIPKFVFRKKYLLPFEVEFYQTIENENDRSPTVKPCGVKTKILSLNFDLFISHNNLRRINERYSKCNLFSFDIYSHRGNLLSIDICSHTECSRCWAFLPPNLSGEIYFEFVLLFQKVAKDLYNAWEDAVKKAKESVKFGGYQIIVTSKDYKSITLGERVYK